MCWLINYAQTSADALNLQAVAIIVTVQGDCYKKINAAKENFICM